jgi:hypothetical protein
MHNFPRFYRRERVCKTRKRIKGAANVLDGKSRRKSCSVTTLAIASTFANYDPID